MLDRNSSREKIFMMKSSFYFYVRCECFVLKVGISFEFSSKNRDGYRAGALGLQPASLRSHAKREDD